ncbi:MAG: ABC transporter permease [Chloroflexota bacterium]|nr:ABC transporter permease [Chloroflexota bacterium]
MIEWGYVHAFVGSYTKGLREGRDFDAFLMGLATGVPTAAVVAWVANSRGDEAIFTYLCVGVVLFGVWNGAAFRTGFSLETEFSLGTFGPSLLTRAPLFVILAGRVASDLTLGLVAAVGGVLTIAAIADVPLQVANVPLFALSAVFGYVTLLCLGLLLSPLMVLSRERSGFTNAVRPFAAVISGFTFAAPVLPIGLEVFTWFWPTAWAMRAVDGSVRGAPWGEIAGQLALGVLLMVVFFGFAQALLRVVERKVRVSGDLAL